MTVQVEWEREEQYFSHLEKKENMEQRLASIRELRVYVSQCKQVHTMSCMSLSASNVMYVSQCKQCHVYTYHTEQVCTCAIGSSETQSWVSVSLPSCSVAT